MVSHKPGCFDSLLTDEYESGLSATQGGKPPCILRNNGSKKVPGQTVLVPKGDRVESALALEMRRATRAAECFLLGAQKNTGLMFFGAWFRRLASLGVSCV